jgi:hypothetical protein
VKFEGTVEEMTGTLEILTTFEVPREDLDAPMSGTWMIVTGTGELENTCGYGTWVYEGADPADHASYSGSIQDCVPPA